jgi:hypothetical protein
MHHNCWISKAKCCISYLLTSFSQCVLQVSQKHKKGLKQPLQSMHCITDTWYTASLFHSNIFRPLVS